MRAVNKVVVVLVAAVSVLMLVEAVIGATTGAPSLGTATASPVVEWAFRVAVLAMSAGLIVVMVSNAAVIDAGRRSRTVLRWITITTTAAYTIFDTGWALLGPDAEALWTADESQAPWWLVLVNLLGWIGNAAPAALGATMLLQGDRSPAAWLLTAAVVVSVLSFWLLGALGSSWASLAYSGAVTNLGLALLGAAPPESDRFRAQEATAV